MTDTQKYYAALERAKISGYLCDDPEAWSYDIVIFLYNENEKIRKKIKALEEALEKSKSYTDNEKRIAEGELPISSEPSAMIEFLTADGKTKAEKALKSAKDKMLAIYETLTPEETRAWEMGEVYAEIVRGLE